MGMLDGRTALITGDVRDQAVLDDAALFLNSDLASAVTGVALPVDAGHMILPGMNLAPVKS